MYSTRLPIAAAVVSLLVVSTPLGCSSDDGAQIPDSVDRAQHRVTERTDDGLLAEKVDTTGDGNYDIIRYFEEYPDPRDEDRTRRRLRKMEVDVTGDDVINVRRYYDDHGNIEREENDQTLDGNVDAVLEFTGGQLSRKLVKNSDGDVEETRIYYDDELVRVEQDTTGNGEVDRWEYYEDNTLMRIGFDTSGDGSADTWQMR